MVLAGDIGGTKTLLGLFDPSGARPQAGASRSFTTLEYPNLGAIIDEFLAALPIDARKIRAACFGVAGPVIDNTARLTNVPWQIDADVLARRFGFARAVLLNDLQAMAYGVPVLEGPEVLVLQEGAAVSSGNIGLIAAGTGLGEAMLHRVDGHLIPAASEGGHADFPARNEREIDVVRWLIAHHGRAEIEGVISGLGLLNLHQVTHTGACPAVSDLADPSAAAALTTAALEHRCPSCVEALALFVDAYGSEAGNLALRTMSTAGLFVGGGIAPKILPALTDGRFMTAFRSKPPYVAMLSAIPVKVILNDQTGLLGAAVHASTFIV
jgi:glucokinase